MKRAVSDIPDRKRVKGARAYSKKCTLFYALKLGKNQTFLSSTKYKKISKIISNLNEKINKPKETDNTQRLPPNRQ